ncbi:diguanylate cyclase domain-containing protein [Halarcobacter sp.]|uniref:diguanylate cyclase domain-containing protein n=1 Tax=Halarcobacter sp. TaxID=2321133 RepID=UPI002AAAEB73|nr:diguanylate cyclase [Halarcobacter sp.]
MKAKLKEITDSTINELLSNEIILPSCYFQCFDKNAKNIDLDLGSESFGKELNNLIFKEYNEINSYINDAVKTIDNAANITKEAEKAIESNDSLLLKSLYNQIVNLKKELESITDNVYKDYLTKTYNKKWLYQKYLIDKSIFKNDTIITLIDVKDYEYISNTYNKLIADNLLMYISSFISNRLEEEDLDFKFVRYLTNKFIIIFEEKDIHQINSMVNLVSNMLFEATLKSNSGILIKPTFEYAIKEAKKEQIFHDILETLIKETTSKN